MLGACVIAGCRHDIDTNASSDLARDIAADFEGDVPGRDMGADADAIIDADIQLADLDSSIDGFAADKLAAMLSLEYLEPQAAPGNPQDVTCAPHQVAIGGGASCDSLVSSERAATRIWRSQCATTISEAWAVCISNKFKVDYVPSAGPSSFTATADCAGKGTVVGGAYVCKGGLVQAAYPEGNRFKVVCTGGTALAWALCTSDATLEPLVKPAAPGLGGGKTTNHRATCAAGAVALGGGCTSFAAQTSSSPFRDPTTGQRGWKCEGSSVTAYVVCAEL